MSILTTILVLVCAGVVLWLINKFIPMEARIKTILNWVVIIVIVIWLIKISGILGHLSQAKI